MDEKRLGSRVVKSWLSVLLGALLFIPFQNCSQTSQNQFSSISSLNEGGLKTESNGDGYMGKPDEGSFIRLAVNETCVGHGVLKAPVEPGEFGRLEVTNSHIELKRDACIDVHKKIEFGSLDLGYLGYNPDFLVLKETLYQRLKGEAPLPQRVELFCRGVDRNQQFFDFIFYQTKGQQSLGLLYSGVDAGGFWLSRSSERFSVEREKSQSEIKFRGSDFQLVANLSAASKQAPAEFSGKIDGVAKDFSLNCLRPHDEPAFSQTPQGLLGLWQFNGNYQDASGNGHHGQPVVIHNRLSFGEGKLGQALYNKHGFQNDPGDHVEVSDSSAFDNLSQLTISTWIHPINLSAADSVVGGIALKRSEDNNSSGWHFGLAGGTARIFFRVAYSDRPLHVNTGNVMPKNKWSHLSVTWDGTAGYGGVRIFLDGEQQTPTIYNVGRGQRLDDSQHKVHFAHFTDDGYELNGGLDQVSIYSKSLSPAEIFALFLTGLPF